MKKQKNADGTFRDWNIDRERPSGNIEFIPSSSDIVDIAAAKQFIELEQAGLTKNIVSMSLYGNDPSYINGALENAKLIRRDWQGWTMRLYHSETVDTDAISKLKELGVELVEQSKTSDFVDHRGAFWRFYPLLEKNVRFIVRDTDSRLTQRDHMAVLDWVKSRHYFHVMRDHPWHDAAILAGMWGAVGGLLKNKSIEDFSERSELTLFSDDQKFLAYQIWPHVQNVTLSHDSFFCERYRKLQAETKPFPTQRLGPEDFVGNPYIAKDNFSGMRLNSQCPTACRKQPDWTFC